jgi:CBS domain-containing protein
MLVAKLLTRRVAVVTRDCTLRDAAQRMRTEHLGDLVVVEQQGNRTVPVGVVTDRDVALAFAVEDPGDATVGRLLGGPAITARKDEDSLTVAQRMRRFGVRRLPVVDETGQLVGIVTVDDLIGCLHAELDEIAHLVTHQARREEGRV